MNFINETVHPKAQALFDMLEAGKTRDEETQYNAVIKWQGQHSMSDEKASDLYAMLEEKFTGLWTKLTPGLRLSGVSYCLWSNDRRYPR